MVPSPAPTSTVRRVLYNEGDGGAVLVATQAFPNAYLEVDEPSVQTGRRALGALGLIGTACFALSMATLHLLPTGYNPISQPLGDYTVGRFSTVMELGLFGGGVGMVGLGLSLRSSGSKKPGMWAGSFLLTTSGLAFFVMGLFSRDLEFIRASLSLVVLTPAAAGMLAASYTKGAKWFIPTVAALATTAIALTMDAVLGLNAGGLTERFLAAVVFSWVLVVSYSAFRRPEALG